MPKMIHQGPRASLGLSVLALAATLVIGGVAPAVSAATVGAQAAPAPKAVDLGVAAPGDLKSITVALALRNQAALEAFIASVSDAKSANFRQFITPDQFSASYGQTPAAVAQVVAYLQSQGFTVTGVAANNLAIDATATNAQITATFGTQIHTYALNGTTYQAPASKTVVPSPIAAVVAAVAGLNDKPLVKSHRVAIPNTGALVGDAAGKINAVPNVTGGNPVGNWTVADLAVKYNINPLYARGLTGAGKTIGILTLAGYDQSDAYAYWNQLGLNVDPHRITDVLIDGGALPKDGPGSEGAGETTLDVEQSGGVAPGANIRVYIAPNTDADFLKLFRVAVAENLADVLSISWGGPEIFYDPSVLAQYHAVFEQAAAQGMPVIAAAGDAGAFDINRDYGYPTCSTMLTVDFPAADPLVLAAGGTTLPNTFMHKHGPVTDMVERPWGWDYLKDYIVGNYGTGLYYSSYYVVGGGGGVSVQYGLPAWQTGLAGTMTSAYAQSLFCGPSLSYNGAFADQVDLPGGLAGRNVPDVALNADPYSGYAEYFRGAWSSGGGGTSFVAPQLNGILTLVSQNISPTAANPKGRVGAPGPQMYNAFKAQGYTSGSPFKAITAGDNEYFKAAAHFNPASGLGSLDVNALATALGATSAP